MSSRTRLIRPARQGDQVEAMNKVRQYRWWICLWLGCAVLAALSGLATPALSYHVTPPVTIQTLPPDSAESLIHLITDLCASHLLDSLCFRNLDTAPPAYTTGEVINANICAELPAETIEHQDAMIPGHKCATHVRQRDGSNLYIPTGIPDDRCYDAIRTQRLCRENAVRQALGAITPPHSSCIPGFEINCQHFLPPDISAAIQQSSATIYPAIATACTGVTVGDIGFSDLTFHQYAIDRACLQAPRNGSGSSAFCTFLGQSIQVDTEYCQVLTNCVEPKLNADFPIIGQLGQAPIYAFPSGTRALNVDLSCSTASTPDSLHNPQHGCRAIDINVQDNYGNLRREALKDPLTNMPPELVAIMETCNVIWGGRYQRAEGVPGGCDPMEFSYAPACEVRGYSYWLDTTPTTVPDTILDTPVLHLDMVTAVHVHPHALTDLITPYHPYWQAPEAHWWLHVRTLDGTGMWSSATNYPVATRLELDYSQR